MMMKIAEFLRQTSNFTLPEDEALDAGTTADEVINTMSAERFVEEYLVFMTQVRQARVLYREMSELMEISIFSMATACDGANLITPTNSIKPDHYDVMVSIKDGDGDIHEIDGLEDLQSEEVTQALRHMSIKYPHATLINAGLLDGLS